MDPASSAKFRQITNLYAHKPKACKVGILVLPSGSVKVSLVDTSGKQLLVEGKVLETTINKTKAFPPLNQLFTGLSNVLGSGRVLSQDEVTQVLLQVKGRIKGTAKRDDVDEVANTIFDAIPENERLAMVSYLDVVTTKSQQTTALKMVEYYNELAKRPVDFSTLRRDCHVVLKKTLVTHGTTTTTLVDFLQSSQGAQLVPDEKLRNRLIELSNNPEALSQNEKEDCELLAQHPETVSLLLQIGQANIGKLQAALWTGFHEMYAEKDPSAALRSRGVRWNMTLLNSGAVVIETNVTYSFQQLGEEPKKLLEMDLNIKRELELKSGKVKQSSISLRNPTIAQEVSAAEKKKRIFLNFIKQTQDFASQIE